MAALRATPIGAVQVPAWFLPVGFLVAVFGGAWYIQVHLQASALVYGLLRRSPSHLC